MRYVLDTDILSLYAHRNPVVVARLDAEPKDGVAITVISVDEQLSGWYSLLRKAKTPGQLELAYDRLAQSVVELARLPILSFALPAIARYEELRKQRIGLGKKWIFESPPFVWSQTPLS